MSKEKLFYVGVKGLIENEERKVLILKADITFEHRAPTEPYWDLPGGRIEVGQSPAEALKREIEEETGIRQVDNHELFTTVISNHEIPFEEGKMAGLVLMVYKVVVPADSKITLSREHETYEWVTREEAAQKLAHKYPDEFTALL